MRIITHIDEVTTRTGLSFRLGPKTEAFAHQAIGTIALVKYPAFALFDECGAGKSKQVVDAACQLAQAGKIDTVVVVCPASVRCVWANEEIGEIKKHSWLRNWVAVFHSKSTVVWQEETPQLQWVITNYEILRSAKWLAEIQATLKGHTCLLVCDESSYIKSRTAAQTKAIIKLRDNCSRCVILNGTPIVNNPLDLYSQMKVIDPHILGENYWAFRAKYCEMVPQRFGKVRFNKIVSYKNLDDLQARIKPYCLRRLKKDCLDLPEKLYTVREVSLSTTSWKRYQELRREALATLPNGDVQIEPNAAVRIMRLAQLTSGHLGGTTVMAPPEAVFNCDAAFTPRDLSSEKLDWCVQYLTEECTARYVIVWCRWRRERERLYEMLRAQKMLTYQLYGSQPKAERGEAINRFSVTSEAVNGALDSASLRCVLLAQQHAGGFGLNLVAATQCIYLSNDFSLGIRLQSEDRCHRPGQKHAVTYIDVLAVGPKGQRTIDHTILAALRAKQDLAQMTASAWRKELETK